MSKPPLAFMEKYGIESDEVWEVRKNATGGVWAIKHAALERVAVAQKIIFGAPTILEARGPDKCAALCVTGSLNGGRSEWSIGEAAPGNNKNNYPFAMAEKRAKDRVILKLLNAHGALYSEDEADEFVRPNPHVTRPEDIFEPTEYDENGAPVDNIPPADGAVKALPKKDTREIFAKCQAEIHECKTVEQLTEWAQLNANRVAVFKPDWQEILRGIYAEHRDALRNGAKMKQKEAV